MEVQRLKLISETEWGSGVQTVVQYHKGVAEGKW